MSDLSSNINNYIKCKWSKRLNEKDKDCYNQLKKNNPTRIQIAVSRATLEGNSN